MPPMNKQDLRRYVEELNLSEPLAANILQELEADEKRALQFVGQRLRHDDYSRKTQELAEQRRGLEAAVSGQVQEYAQKLQEADLKMAQILKDFENEKISRVTAETRLQTVAKRYEIPEEDIPKVEPVRPTQPVATGIDQATLDKLLEAREAKLIEKLMPELMSFPEISNIQQQIREDHHELTGKRLTAAEMKELTAEAPKAGGLIKAWEQKFAIGDVRMKKHDEDLERKILEREETKRKAKASEEAIASIHNQDNGIKPLSTSPVIRTYKDRGREAAESEGLKNGNGNGKEPESRQSGAERAATKWVERRNQGIGLGKEAPTK